MQIASASQQSVTDYFESTAAYWKAVYSDDRLLPIIYRDRHHTALGWIHDLGLRPDARILEVGCGAGLITIALAGDGYTVNALDSTMAMLQMTRDEAARNDVQGRVWLHSADVHALPFPAQTFDLVIAIGVIPWLHSERLALQEMQRVLKPGGSLLVTADNNMRLNRILDPRSSPCQRGCVWPRSVFFGCSDYGLRAQGFSRNGTLRASLIAALATAVSKG
jgi:ubiquinone/menaquinone biosynthesis C-methylase UbiE